MADKDGSMRNHSGDSPYSASSGKQGSPHASGAQRHMNERPTPMKNHNGNSPYTSSQGKQPQASGGHGVGANRHMQDPGPMKNHNDNSPYQVTDHGQNTGQDHGGHGGNPQNPGPMKNHNGNSPYASSQGKQPQPHSGAGQKPAKPTAMKNGNQHDPYSASNHPSQAMKNQSGAFRNLNHNSPNPAAKVANVARGGRGNLGAGLGSTGQLDPNLEDLNKGFNAGQRFANRGPLPGGPNDPNQAPMQKGLADPDKNPEKQKGDPLHQGPNDPPAEKQNDPLRKYGKGMPQQLANLGGKVGASYSKVTGSIASGITKAGKALHISISKGLSLTIAKWMMIGGLGGGVFGVSYLSQKVPTGVLTGGQVCSVQNNGDDTYADKSSPTAGGLADLSNPNAKKIFDWLTKKDGFSGAGAAGAVAVAQRESGFNPKAMNAGGGVAGIFQWSGWSNHVNGDRIHQGGIIKSEADLTLENEMKLVEYEFKHGKGNVADEVGHADDPVKATMMWSQDYEGVSLGDSQSKVGSIAGWAQQAYAKFHGSSIKADDSKLKALAGSDNTGVANSNAATAEQANTAQCKGQGDNGPAVSGNWDWPFPNFDPKVIGPDQDFGWRTLNGAQQWHDGIDIGTASKTGDVHAIHGGKVVKINLEGTSQSSLGYHIVVESPDGYCEIYQEFAFSKADGDRVTKVKVGDNVKTGQVITKLDPSLWNVTHIHIGVYKGKYKDLGVNEQHYDDPNWKAWQDPEKIIKEAKGK